MNTFLLIGFSKVSVACLVFAAIFVLGFLFWLMIRKVLLKQGNNLLAIYPLLCQISCGIAFVICIVLGIIFAILGDDDVFLGSNRGVSSPSSATDSIDAWTLDDAQKNLDRHRAEFDRRESQRDVFGDLKRDLAKSSEQRRREREIAEREFAAQQRQSELDAQESMRKMQEAQRKLNDSIAEMHRDPFGRNSGGSPTTSGRSAPGRDIPGRTLPSRSAGRSSNRSPFGSPFNSPFSSPLGGSTGSPLSSSSGSNRVEAKEFDPQDLGNPSEAFPPLKITMSRAKRTDLVGFEGDTDFEDMAVDKSIMVGMAVGVAKQGGRSIQNLQPIYQTEDRYILGEICGNDGGKKVLLMASSGYAVGGINVSGVDSIAGLQLVFLRCERGVLNKERIRESDWVGIQRSNQSQLVAANGKHIVGLFGQTDGTSVTGIGLASFLAKRDTAAIRNRVAEAQKKQSQSTQQSGTPKKRELRTWTSANGKYTVQAVLEAISGPKVMLQPPNQADVIYLDINQLSEEDQQYVRDRK